MKKTRGARGEKTKNSTEAGPVRLFWIRENTFSCFSFQKAGLTFSVIGVIILANNRSDDEDRQNAEAADRESRQGWKRDCRGTEPFTLRAFPDGPVTARMALTEA
ncbi:MAG: hypothetical protein ACI4WZ_07045 [Eubacteriales bacterium]